MKPKLPKERPKGRVKKPRRKSKFNFEGLKPGDSLYYEGYRSSITLAYGYYLAKGRYETKPEGKGWRFTLMEPKIKKE